MEWGSKMGTPLGGSCAGGSVGEEANQAALGRGWAVDCGWATDGGASRKIMMTDEQIEVLRKQISAYATISEKLVEWHGSLAASEPNSVAGMKLGDLYGDPLITTSHKMSTRQRWNPTPMQLQILEGIFNQGDGTPNREKIKEITTELSKHGQISVTNVYNWFQNRRARYKRKRLLALSDNVESEADTEVNSPVEKNISSRNASIHEPDPTSDGVASNIPRNSHKVRFADISSSGGGTLGNFSSDDGTSSSAQNICLASFCDGILSDSTGLQQLMEGARKLSGF